MSVVDFYGNIIILFNTVVYNIRILYTYHTSSYRRLVIKKGFKIYLKLLKNIKRAE